MSDAVRRLVRAARAVSFAASVGLDRVGRHNSPTECNVASDRMSKANAEMETAIRAVEAELNAPPAVTEKPGFDGRSTDYPDYVENYR